MVVDFFKKYSHQLPSINQKQQQKIVMSMNYKIQSYKIFHKMIFNPYIYILNLFFIIYYIQKMNQLFLVVQFFLVNKHDIKLIGKNYLNNLDKSTLDGINFLDNRLFFSDMYDLSNSFCWNSNVCRTLPS